MQLNISCPYLQKFVIKEYGIPAKLPSSLMELIKHLKKIGIKEYNNGLAIKNSYILPYHLPSTAHNTINKALFYIFQLKLKSEIDAYIAKGFLQKEAIALFKLKYNIKNYELSYENARKIYQRSSNIESLTININRNAIRITL